MGARKSRRRYGKAAGRTVRSAMRRRKRGTLRRGKGGRGGKVKSRKQAIAIGLTARAPRVSSRPSTTPRGSNRCFEVAEEEVNLSATAGNGSGAKGAGGRH
jgi:hypothetical protein